MNGLSRAYNELVGLLLTEEDRTKFEYFIGAALSYSPPNRVEFERDEAYDGHPNVLIVHGHPGSGKSTLLNIARRVIMSDELVNLSVPISFQHEGYLGPRSFYPETFVFAASPYIFDDSDGLMHIQTTGDTVAVNKHYVLMNQIHNEASAIAEHCRRVYTDNRENN
jgi:energy-coupling factor transporter ATP-binding protein EcfA2